MRTGLLLDYPLFLGQDETRLESRKLPNLFVIDWWVGAGSNRRPPRCQRCPSVPGRSSKSLVSICNSKGILKWFESYPQTAKPIYDASRTSRRGGYGTTFGLPLPLFKQLLLNGVLGLPGP